MSSGSARELRKSPRAIFFKERSLKMEALSTYKLEDRL